jgi:hypothetical protein
MVLMKGEPKTGKSIAASSFPKPMFIFDMDGRMESVANYWAKHNPVVMDQVEYKTYNPEDYLIFKEDFEFIQTEARSPISKKIMRTVCLDGVTSTGEMVIDYALSERDSASEKRRGVIKLMGIEDFGVEAMGFVQILSIGREIRKHAHFILTAHVIITEQEALTKAGRVTHTSRQLLTGGKKVASKLPVSFDEVWHFGAELVPTDKGMRKKMTVFFNHSGVDFAGTSRDLPPGIEWTDGSLWDLVQKELSKGQTIYKAGGVQKL